MLTKSLPGDGGRRALLIGNDAYTQVRALTNAAKDARDLGAVLASLGFTTTVRTDLTGKQMRDVLGEFAAQLGPGDIAFFFYAGHGIQVNGANLLVPVDVIPVEAEVKKASLELKEIQAKLQHARAGLTVMAIDACRNNPVQKGRGGFLNGFSPMESGAGGLIAFSTGPGQTASDGEPGRNGLYTARLLNVLPEPLPVLAIFRKVRDQVYEASQGAQRPYVMEDVIGDYYLSRTSAAAKPAKPAAQGGEPRPAALPIPPPPGADAPIRQVQTPPPSGEQRPAPLPIPAPPPDAPAAPSTPAERDAQEAMARGLRLLHAGDYQGSAQAFDQARRIQPGNASAYQGAGLAYSGMTMFSLAADLFSKAIALDPGLAAAYLHRGLIYLKVPNYKLAVQDFSWAVESDPLDPVGYTNRGKAYLGIREYESASSDFQRALELYGDDVEAYQGLGVVSYRLNKLPESIEALNAAVARRSDAAEIYEDRARTLKALGKAGEAEQDLRRAAQLRGK